MNQLLPIIRRVRRPLVVADKPPMVASKVEVPAALAQVVAEAETLKAEPAEAGTPSKRNETAPTNRKAR